MEALRGIDTITCLDAKPFMKYPVVSHLTKWNTSDYKKIVFSKLDAILYTMKQYNQSNIGYIDTDIIVLKDPTPLFLSRLQENPEVSVFSQCDEESQACSNMNHCKNICSGVIVFRQLPIIQTALEYSNADPILHYGDQEYLCHTFRRLNIRYQTIERSLLLNGLYPGVKDPLRKVDLGQQAYLLHFNYMFGHLKEPCMKKNEMWYI